MKRIINQSKLVPLVYTAKEGLGHAICPSCGKRNRVDLLGGMILVSRPCAHAEDTAVDTKQTWCVKFNYREAI